MIGILQTRVSLLHVSFQRVHFVLHILFVLGVLQLDRVLGVARLFLLLPHLVGDSIQGMQALLLDTRHLGGILGLIELLHQNGEHFGSQVLREHLRHLHVPRVDLLADLLSLARQLVSAALDRFLELANDRGLVLSLSGYVLLRHGILLAALLPYIAQLNLHVSRQPRRYEVQLVLGVLQLVLEVVLAHGVQQALHVLEGDGLSAAHPVCHVLTELLERRRLRKGNESLLDHAVHQGVPLLVQLGEDVATDDFLDGRLDVALLDGF